MIIIVVGAAAGGGFLAVMGGILFTLLIISALFNQVLINHPNTPIFVSLFFIAIAIVVAFVRNKHSTFGDGFTGKNILVAVLLAIGVFLTVDLSWAFLSAIFGVVGGSTLANQIYASIEGAIPVARIMETIAVAVLYPPIKGKY